MKGKYYKKRVFRVLLTLTFTFAILLSLVISASAMQIFVLGFDNTKVSLDVEPSDTILSVKEKVQEKTSIPVESQVLIYAAKQLENSRTLADYNIQKEFELHLALKHTHAWEYSLNGTDTIVAHCSAEGHTGDDVSLILNAISQNYSGSTYSGASLDSYDWENAELELPTIQYVGRENTTYLESAIAPTNGGTYIAKITVENVTATREFSIIKLPQTLSFTENTITKTYGDAPFMVAATGYETTVTYTSSNPEVATVDATTGEVTIQKVGNVTIIATAASNEIYEEKSASYTLTINKAKNAINSFSMANWQEGEKASESSITALFGNATFVYANASDGQFTMTEKPTKAGNYIVKAIIAGTDNYEGAEMTATFTIFAAENALNMNLVVIIVVSVILVGVCTAGCIFFFRKKKSH